MRAWLWFGHTEAWIRLPSVLFAIASIPLLYALARRLIGEKAALAAAVLFALSPTDVYYSQEARGYTMTILLVLASTWFFVRAVEENRRARLASLGGFQRDCVL
jgi:mannosyltransferase